MRDPAKKRSKGKQVLTTTAKVRKCTHCKKEGHNKTTCPEFKLQLSTGAPSSASTFDDRLDDTFDDNSLPYTKVEHSQFGVDDQVPIFLSILRIPFYCHDSLNVVYGFEQVDIYSGMAQPIYTEMNMEVHFSNICLSSRIWKITLSN